VRRLPATAALLAILALTVPTPALGQGAGDEQYKDPFAGQQPGNGQSQQPQGKSTGTPAPAPATATQGTQSAGSTTTQSQPAGTLPRTGFEGVFLLLGYGWALLVGGAALRRIAAAPAGRR